MISYSPYKMPSTHSKRASCNTLLLAALFALHGTAASAQPDGVTPVDHTITHQVASTTQADQSAAALQARSTVSEASQSNELITKKADAQVSEAVAKDSAVKETEALDTLTQTSTVQTSSVPTLNSSDTSANTTAATASDDAAQTMTATTALSEPNDYIDASAQQIQLLPIKPPSLRDGSSHNHRLARHSQIVHSKVIAWLDLPYAQSTGFRPVTLDLFVPNNSVAGDANLPLLIVLHEGNPQHFHSQYNRHFANTADLFADIAATGVTVAAINYRSPKETTINGQVNDLRAAVRWLELNASDYRLGNHYALWSFDQAGEIVQAYLSHRQQQAGSDKALTAQSMQLTKVALWHPTQLQQDLDAVPLLAINPQTVPALLHNNQYMLRYRHFDSAEAVTNNAAVASEPKSTAAKPSTAANNTEGADARLDALSRTLQFLFDKK